MPPGVTRLVQAVLFSAVSAFAIAHAYGEWAVARNLVEHGVQTSAIVREVHRGRGVSISYQFTAGGSRFTGRGQPVSPDDPLPRVGDRLPVVYDPPMPAVSRIGTIRRLDDMYPRSPVPYMASFIVPAVLFIWFMDWMSKRSYRKAVSRP